MPLRTYGGCWLRFPSVLHFFELARGSEFYVRHSDLVRHGIGNLPQRIAPDAIDLGYDFIQHNCPATSENLARQRWVAKQLADEASPIYGWKKNDVKEAMQ